MEIIIDKVLTLTNMQVALLPLHTVKVPQTPLSLRIRTLKVIICTKIRSKNGKDLQRLHRTKRLRKQHLSRAKLNLINNLLQQGTRNKAEIINSILLHKVLNLLTNNKMLHMVQAIVQTRITQLQQMQMQPMQLITIKEHMTITMLNKQLRTTMAKHRSLLVPLEVKNNNIHKAKKEPNCQQLNNNNGKITITICTTSSTINLKVTKPQEKRRKEVKKVSPNRSEW